MTAASYNKCEWWFMAWLHVWLCSIGCFWTISVPYSPIIHWHWQWCLGRYYFSNVFFFCVYSVISVLSAITAMFCTLCTVCVWRINLLWHKCVSALTPAITTNTSTKSDQSGPIIMCSCGTADIILAILHGLLWDRWSHFRINEFINRWLTS